MTSFQRQLLWLIPAIAPVSSSAACPIRIATKRLTTQQQPDLHGNEERSPGVTIRVGIRIAFPGMMLNAIRASELVQTGFR